MPKAKKRKIPITSSLDTQQASSSNPQATRTLIRSFHVLLKKQTQLQNASQNSENILALADVEREIEKLGGLEAYQRMSSIGQGDDRGGGSEKILIDWLREQGKSSRGTNDKLRLLEVGALKPDNYRSCHAWIQATPMDLRSRHPSILEQDFLLMDSDDEYRGKWDILSLSLVVNFVPVAADRGRMLLKAHQMLSSKGLLFLALPLPCVENSRYLTFDHLKDLMNAIGFKQIYERWKKGGKMAYWLYEKDDNVDALEQRKFQKKVILRQGDRNNFSIIL